MLIFLAGVIDKLCKKIKNKNCMKSNVNEKYEFDFFPKQEKIN